MRSENAGDTRNIVRPSGGVGQCQLMTTRNTVTRLTPGVVHHVVHKARGAINSAGLESHSCTWAASFSFLILLPTNVVSKPAGTI